MEITLKDVENLATLSALEFTDGEKQEFVKDFSNILDMVNQIQKVQTSDASVFNRSHKLAELREDKPEESLPQEEILLNAPKARRGCFNVPLVVE